MNKVLMYPSVKSFGNNESGIRRVIEAYEKYLPRYGWEVTNDENDYDITAIHAGTSPRPLDVAHCHGLYWSADYTLEPWAWHGNKLVLEGVRKAKHVTVPSRWVQEVFERDMRFSPHVIPHGIDWWKYEPKFSGSYVLWNKNRAADVCDPTPINVLATRATDVHFVSTFSNATLRNLKIIGPQPHADMMRWLENAAVYLATTKETAGIGILEAMAMGKPILGYAHGGVVDFVVHGVNGYLAEPDNLDDLLEGLRFCLSHKRELGENSVELVKRWTWDKAVKKLAKVYDACLVEEPNDCDVIIPVFNKSPEVLARAISSALSQTKYLGNVIVVDDGSSPELSGRYEDICQSLPVKFYRKENGGVATARNYGIGKSESRYVCCLDADDAIHADFLLACVPELEADRSLGMAYTGIWAIDKNDKQGLTAWPGDCDYDKQFQRKNQVPTCCVFRKEMWERLGGYKQRYAPTGAGAEDAEFWLRAMACGWGAKKVTEAGLFIYSLGQGHTSQGYTEVDWTAWHPWTKDGLYPMAAMAKPRRHAHPVRQYDQPAVSVIIPVGPGHEEALVDALDSLEAQTFRKWEAVVAWDSPKTVPAWIMRAYPYLRLVYTGGGKGAGYARNRGVEISRGPMLLYLDSDDFLAPDCIEKMLDGWSRYGTGMYSDYHGIAYVDDPSKLSRNIRLIERNEKTGLSVMYYKAAEYDMDKAARQPEDPPYLFSNITVLIPRRWHDEIGGFDEAMPSLEDYDYWTRMAKAGKCFCRISEPLLSYRFHSGYRRDWGFNNRQELLDYMKIKYSKELQDGRL